MKIKQLTTRDASVALERIADYYRHSELYMHVSNMNDAYDFYKKEYAEDTKVMIDQGYSYQYKGNYLIAVDFNRLKTEHPDVAEHYFVVADIEAMITREPGEVLFICCFGPRGEYIDSTGYTLINEFVSLFPDKVLLTDCMVDADVEDFKKNTTGRFRLAGGQEYFRWGSK